MSRRHSRRSSGLAPLAPLGPDDRDDDYGMFVERQRYDDSLWEHKKQNKEIIESNTTKQKMIKVLGDSNLALQKNVQDLVWENVLLKNEVKRLKKQLSVIGAPEVLGAIESILDAFPAFHMLRQSLSTLPAQSSGAENPSNSKMTFTSIERPTESRLTTMGKPSGGLPDLWEQEEEGCVDESRANVKLRGRQTDVGSVAVSRMPRPLNPVSPARSSVSPSPRKTITPRKVGMKRRRESGLLVPRPRSKSPEIVLCTAVEGGKSHLQEPATIEIVGGGELSEKLFGDTGDWKEGSLLETGPSEALALAGEDSQDFAMDFKGKEKLRRVQSEFTGDIVEYTNMGLPNPLGDQDEAALAEAKGRSRRARSSVSYKEPSLVKKMRKPDGIQSEEVLKPLSRKSMSPRKSPRKSKGRTELHRSSPPPIPPMPGKHIASSRAITSACNVSMSSQSMRRKSDLLKPPGSKALYVATQRRESADDIAEFEDDAGDKLDIKLGRSLQIAGPSRSQSSSSTSTSSHLPAVTSFNKPLSSASVPIVSLNPLHHLPTHGPSASTLKAVPRSSAVTGEVVIGSSKPPATISDPKTRNVLSEVRYNRGDQNVPERDGVSMVKISQRKRASGVLPSAIRQ